MGPRPNGRGKARRGALEHQPHPDASMGPRPNGRGKGLAVAVAAAFGSRQWGRGQTAAESSRTRCAGRPRPSASMGPRPNGRGKSIIDTPMKALTSMRQWGRGQTAAESHSQHRDHATCLASMGPRPNGRGKIVHVITLGAWAWRQWGRGQTAAERTSPVPYRPRPEASMGPRPNGRGKALATAQDVRRRLGVNGAAAKRPRKDKGGHIIRIDIEASMGPRPNGRGKSRRRVPAVQAWNVRQWGRGQTAAESFARLGGAIYIFRRQWGRGQTAAERPTRCSAGRCAPGVNGAAAKRPRKAAEYGTAWTVPVRVNGAAAKRPRKGERGRRAPS